MKFRLAAISKLWKKSILIKWVWNLNSMILEKHTFYVSLKATKSLSNAIENTTRVTVVISRMFLRSLSQRPNKIIQCVTVTTSQHLINCRKPRGSFPNQAQKQLAGCELAVKSKSMNSINIDFFHAKSWDENQFGDDFQLRTFDFVPKFKFDFIMNNIEAPRASVNCAKCDSLSLSTTSHLQPVDESTSKKVNILFRCFPPNSWH